MFCRVNSSYNESDTFPPSITRICIKTKRKCHVDEYRANGEGSENVTIKMNVLFFKFVGVYSNSLKMANVVSLSLELNSVGTALKQFGKRKKKSSWGVYALQRTSHKEISRHGRATKKYTKKRAAPVKFVVLVIKASSTRKQRFFPPFSKECASPRSVFKSIHPLTRKR